MGEGGPINVRFGALSGHKSDIVICPLSADFVAKVVDGPEEQ
jgi:hypothetical protein